MSVKEDTFSWLRLTSAEGVGPLILASLLERFGSPAGILDASEQDLRQVRRVGRKTALNILDGITVDRAEKIMASAKKAGAEIITYSSPLYPPLLKEIPDPPFVLYCKGNPDCLERKCISVVGSRRASTYGKSTSEKLAADLARVGLTVVSGMARGIDSAAHMGALSAAGKTAAVLGSGIDVPYPKENRGLMERVITEGCVLTEFPPGTPPEGRNFPVRNRIISGLSLGTLVVEAADRSGSLITAHLALEQNRELFALPGNITSRNSVGTNYLIKKGAKLVQRWQDIAEEIMPAEDIAAEPENAAEEQAFSDDEKKVLRILSCDEPLHIDKLSSTIGMETPVLLTHLLTLELRGMVRQLPGKQFVKTFR